MPPDRRKWKNQQRIYQKLDNAPLSFSSLFLSSLAQFSLAVVVVVVAAAVAALDWLESQFAAEALAEKDD